MNAIVPLAYDNQILNFLELDGDAWVVGTDAARVLGYANPSDALSRLHPDDRRVATIALSEGSRVVTRERTLINESGVYELVFGSSLPSARAFKHWVTHEVLPSIRTRGGYLTPEATEAALTDPDFIIRLATELKKERAQRAELEAQAHADRPKVIFADAVAASQTDILVGDLAKILRGNGVQIGANRLFAWLRDNGFLIRREGTDYNSPTQRSMEMGLFRIKETAITHSDGHVTVSKTPKVTGRGQAYFVERFLREHDGEAA